MNCGYMLPIFAGAIADIIAACTHEQRGERL